MKAKHIILSLFILATTCSCEKEDDPTKENPFNGRTTAQFNPKKDYGTVTDIDGNVYKTIKIGDQVWMAENLRTTHYQDGEALSQNDYTWYREGDTLDYTHIFTPHLVQHNATEYTEEDLNTIATHGFSYSWYAATDKRNIAPKGWRVPSSKDWERLITYLSDNNKDSIASLKLRAKGDLYWEDGDSPFLNISGFTAVPWIPYAGSSHFWATDIHEWTSENNEIYEFVTHVFIQPDGASFFYTDDYLHKISIRCIKEKQ